MHDFYRKHLPPAALSDVIRVNLLRRFGGIWVDATTYCLRPLNEWIYRATEKGFFAFHQPGPNKMLSSWFLAAGYQSYVIEALFRYIQSYWSEKHGPPDEYFWLHTLFQEAYQADEEFRRLWDLSPKLSAAGPHCFMPYEENLLAPVTDSHRLIVETAQTPLLKLTHKLEHNAVEANAVYRWLCDRLPNFIPDAPPGQPNKWQSA